MLWKSIRYAACLPMTLLIMSCGPGNYNLVVPPAYTPQTASPGGYPPSSQPPASSHGGTPFNLNGQWTGNFQCPLGTYHQETVKVAQNGQQLSAKKITGDPCVPAGYKSFEGSLSGNSGQLTCFTGSHASPASGYVQGTLRVIDANSFEACTVRFVRAGPAVGSPGTPPTYTAPVVQPGVKNVAPQYSPVHIWVPNNWINAHHPYYTSQFNATFGDPNEEVVVGFRFVNGWNTARSDRNNLISWLGQNLLIPGSMVPSGAIQSTQINGMQAEFQEFTGQFNAPGQADHGQSVDLAAGLVFVPGYNRAVCVVAMGLSRDVPRHQHTTQQILASLAPRP